MDAAQTKEHAAAPLPLTLETTLLFGLASIGSGIYSMVPSVMLLYYMTQVLTIPVTLASSAILLPKLVIIVFDPLVGMWSDRLVTPWGRRAPFLAVGGVLVLAAFVTLFNLPKLSDPFASAALVSLAYLGLALATSLFFVPYIAMPAELTSSPSERTRLIGVRMVLLFIGILVGATAPSLLVGPLGGGAPGYGAMAWIVGAVASVSMIGVVRVALRLKDGATPASEGGFRDLGGVFADGAYRAALGIYFLTIIANGVAAAAAPYYMVFALGQPESNIALLLGTQLIVATLATPLWSWVLTRTGTFWAYAAALLANIVASVGFQFADPNSVVIVAVMGGLGIAGIQVVAFGGLADLIVRHGRRFGMDRAGLMTGVWTATEKVALALGPAICGLVLSLGGFLSGVERAALPASALVAARLTLSGAPGVVLLLALAFHLAFGREKS